MGKVHGKLLFIKALLYFKFISVETPLIYVSFLLQRGFLCLGLKFKIIYELKKYLPVNEGMGMVSLLLRINLTISF